MIVRQHLVRDEQVEYGLVPVIEVEAPSVRRAQLDSDHDGPLELRRPLSLERPTRFLLPSRVFLGREAAASAASRIDEQPIG
jgi:hypothetical protein